MAVVSVVAARADAALIELVACWNERLRRIDEYLVLKNYVLNGNNSAILELSDLARVQQGPRLGQEIVTEDYLVLQPINLSIPYLQLHVRFLMHRTCLDILDDLDALFHHELEYLELNRVQRAFLAPLLLDVVAFESQQLKPRRLFGYFLFEIADLLIHLINLFVYYLHLDVCATFLLDDEITLRFLIQQAPSKAFHLFLCLADGNFASDLFFEMVL